MTVGIWHEKLLAAVGSSYHFVLESISDGFAVFDPYDRMIFCNSRFSNMMSSEIGRPVIPGSQYEWILRRLLDESRIALDGLHAEDWLAAQLAKHRNPGEPYLQIRSDGRAIQITERRTHDGGSVAVCTDVTDFQKAALTSIEEAKKLNHYFDAPPVAIWEEDWSRLKIRIDQLLNAGVTDIRNYLKSKPELQVELVKEIRWKGFDDTAIDLYRADSRRALEKYLSPAPVTAFVAYPDAIASFLEGHRQVGIDTTDRAVDGTELLLVETFQLPKNNGSNWSSVMASSQPIVELKQVMIDSNKNSGVPTERSPEKGQNSIFPVQRSSVTSRMLDIKSMEAATFETVLNTLSVAVLLIGANLKIIHANSAAQTLLEAGDPIGSHDGALKPQSQQVTAALRAVLPNTARTKTAIGDYSHRIPAQSANGDPYVLHVLTLKHRSMPAELTLSAIAAIFVTPAIGQSQSPDAALAALFNLTRAEARVLSEIASGSTLPDVARTLNIGASTVKTHLLKIFSKTGTHRQADLVRLVVSLTFPL